MSLHTTPIDPNYIKAVLVHLGDRPSSVKVTLALNDSNYHLWVSSMCRAVSAKMKVEFVDGYIPFLEDHFDPSICAWNRCFCGAMGKARRNNNILYVIRLLTSLNENIVVVKSQIILVDPLSTMNKIFSMIFQHETG
ncbi:uncharacterized protein LOC127081999 [Lathyrus oleraceus]|uniref:uncharacterized protein LOC127081999 n=1 Tax=Pisum sativum TaxID=3888 RepID=UPI0021D13DFA|nr:uncharacterized protein LOC127081999 [Pisum sativum]